MNLFSEYNRLTLTVMVSILLLSGMAYYFLLHHVLIHELDEDLLEKRQRIEAYAAKHGTLPVFENLDDIQVFYVPALSAAVPRSFTYIGRYNPEIAGIGEFRQYSYIQQLPGKNFTVTIIKPVEGIQNLLRVIIGVTITSILLIISLSVWIKRKYQPTT